jgi:2-deoxy-D-gluconate 3-dehydrogenase
LFDLSGKVALVTGGNGGIGLGIARGLAEAGADVAVAGRNTDKTTAAVAELQGLRVKSIGLQCDVTDVNQVQQMVASTVDQLGGLDILIVNAGTNIRKLPQEYSLEEWHTLIDTNLTSAFTCCQAAYPRMVARGGGKIITIGSMTSLFGFGVGPVYAATKGGIVQLTRSLAVAWAPDNIQVNALLPGWINTDLTIGARQKLTELHDDVVKRTPADRWGEPADMAGPAVFLSSSASDFVTGVALPVDGGFSVSMF